MVHIKKIKLFNGEVRYAVVEPFTSTTKDKNGQVVTSTEDYAVEYKSGEGKNAVVRPAIFPATDEGLEQAKEIQKIFKKGIDKSKK